MSRSLEVRVNESGATSIEARMGMIFDVSEDILHGCVRSVSAILSACLGISTHINREILSISRRQDGKHACSIPVVIFVHVASVS